MITKSLKGISLLRLIPVFLTLVFMSYPVTTEAQTKVQKGVARKITKTANEAITPVPGVQVTVGTVTSPKSDQNGKFSVNVAQSADGSYLLSRVRMPEGTDYELVLPNISKKLYLSPNDLEIIVISKKEKDEDFKEKYRILKKKYNDTSKQLIAVREELEDKKLDYDAQSKEYAALNQQLDSVQNLIDQYFNESNREQITKLLRSVAEEMTLTDYQSLDSLQRKIYDLKCEGDWQTISELILKSMNGDCATYLKEGKELVEAAQAVVRSAQEEFERRCGMALQQIEAYKMLHQNDSVSYYYDLLIGVNPTNWDYITSAATFESTVKGNNNKAIVLNLKASEIAENDSLRAINFTNLGIIYSHLGLYEQALAAAEKSLELRTSIYDPDDINLVKSYEVLSLIYSELDQLEKANEMIDKAFNILSHYDEITDIYTLLYNKGIILSKLDRNQEALDVLEKALSYFSDNSNNDELIVKASILNQIGLVNASLSRFSDAYKAHMESLNILVPIVSEIHPDVAANFNNIGALFKSLSQYEPAIEFTQKGLEILRSIYGENSPAVATAYNNLANLVIKEDPQKGLELFDKALDLNEKLHGRCHSSVALVLNNLSLAYFDLGEMEKGSNAILESIDIYRKLYGENNSHLIAAYNNYAQVLKEVQELDKALEYYLKALEISLSIYGEESESTASLLNNLGTFYYSLGQYDKSTKNYKKSLEIRKSIFGSDNSDVADTYKNLAGNYLHIGEFERANECYEKSVSISKALNGEQSIQYMSDLLNYAYFLGFLNKFTKGEEIATKVSEIFLNNLGETNAQTIYALGVLYHLKLDHAKADGKETEFYTSHMPYTYVADGGEAYNRGLSGKYRLLAIDQWNFTKPESFDYYLQNHANPFTILFYRDGEIIAESFDGKAGIATVWAPIEPDEREFIMNCYEKWLKEAE